MRDVAVRGTGVAATPQRVWEPPVGARGWLQRRFPARTFQKAGHGVGEQGKGGEGQEGPCEHGGASGGGHAREVLVTGAGNNLQVPGPCELTGTPAPNAVTIKLQKGACPPQPLLYWTAGWWARRRVGRKRTPSPSLALS